MRDKTHRLRGSQSHGRGWRKSRHKGGSRGGVGRAGTRSHKRISRILEQKKLIASRRVTCIRDLESKLKRYLDKKILIEKTIKNEPVVFATQKFYLIYRKILSQGEPSRKYVFDLKRIKLSSAALAKIS